MVRIEIAPLRKGLNRLELRPSAGDVDLDSDMFSNILVQAEVDVQTNQLLVRFDVEGDAHLTCDRTLQPYVDRLSGAYAVLFTSRDSDVDGEVSDVKVFSPSDRFVDISDAVRDTLILALPTRRVAPGADEIEIPNRFGEDERDEIDPRWEALRRLQR